MDNIILIYILLILVALFVIYNLMFVKEGFSDYNPNLVGHEEGLPDEYRFLDYPKQKIKLQNMKAHAGNNWHLRFPYMIPQRYSYDDLPIDCPCTSIFNFANIKELPQEVKNRYYAKVPWELSKKSPEYYPDMTNQKYKCQGCPKWNYPFYDSLRRPYLTDTKYDILMHRKPIYGYDYDNMHESTTNAGEGTSDHYYTIDRIINKAQ